MKLRLSKIMMLRVLSILKWLRDLSILKCLEISAYLNKVDEKWPSTNGVEETRDSVSMK